MPFLVYQEASVPNLILMILGAALCLLSYLLRLVAHISIYRRGINIIDFRFLLVVNFLGYLGWGYWCGADPVKMNIPSAVSMSAGAPLAVIGFCLFLHLPLGRHHRRLDPFRGKEPGTALRPALWRVQKTDLVLRQDRKLNTCL
ncbi:MAG: hypothetical protein JSV89_07480 [Spirochaetaceae bacterium]|nr:MAG: hypothetical protein JSV89_07480 [Spirochaetaceae bacterium]